MNAHQANLSELMSMLNRYRDAAGRLEDLVECTQCGMWHKPDIPLGRGGFVCSEDCLDKWVQYGRYLR